MIVSPQSAFRWSLEIFLALIICGLLGCAPVASGKSLAPFSARLWQTDDGLPHSAVQAVTQSDEGYLWIGTQSGLARFDGDQFETWPVQQDHIGREVRVNALTVTRNGNLWIGTATDGLFTYSDKELIHHDLPPGADKMILCLHESKDGSLWVGTRTGLVRFQDGLFTLTGDTNAPRADPENYLAVQTVRSMAEDADGNIWVAYPGMLVQVRDGHAVTNFNMQSINPDLFIRAVCIDRQGTIWIGSNSGLTRFRNGEFRHFSKTNGLPDNTVTAVYEDHRGDLWIGTYGGLCRFVDDRFVVEMMSGGEPYDQVSSFFEDREKNLWVGTKEGLCRLNARSFFTYTTQYGLAHNNVVSVYEDSGGALWIGTWGGGLHRLEDGKMTVFSTANTDILKYDLILALHGTRDGSLWFGMDYDGGLYQYRDGNIQKFGAAEGMPHNAIRTLWLDRNGRLLIGLASGGMRVYTGGKFIGYGKGQGLPSVGVRAFCEAQDGTIWIGTDNGLARWEGKKFKTFTRTNGLSDDAIFSLYEDKDRTLWIGTGNGGLNRMKDGVFKSCTVSDGLFDNNILEILEDDFGRLWMASYRGVFRVDKKELEAFASGAVPRVNSTSFGKADGMNSPICVGIAKPSAWKSKDGRLWFATTKGLAVTDPALTLERNEIPPPVIIRKVAANNDELSLASTTDPVRVEPGAGAVTFEYKALSFRAPERNSFKYKLEGVDADWVDAGTRREAHYNNLRPGHYVFRVMGSNSDGVWSESGASFAFVLLPHLWQTAWFNVAAGIGVLSIVAGGARYLTKRRMQWKLRRLEQQHAVEKERARIAQDMHDEVGAKLTRITFLGGLAKNRLGRPEEAQKEIDKIMGTARDLIGALDEIVWAVDPRNDTLDNFANYVCRYASEFFENTSVLCELQVPDELPNLPLTADVRHNLFLAVKEALNNSLKHARATRVVVQLALHPARFELVISDNGIGFTPSDAAVESVDRSVRTGNGLRNMRERLGSVGGRCCIESAGQGTRVSFVIPLGAEQRRPGLS